MAEQVLGALVFLAIVAGVVWYQRGQRVTDAATAPLVRATPDASLASGVSCAGKQSCSQMTSCEEAKFYLAHCPDAQMDGDGDGVPCESQWCDAP